MVRAFRRFKELPESGDKAAMQEILGVEVDMPASTAPAPVSSAPHSQCPAEIQNGTTAVPQDEASDELVEGFWLEAEDYLNAIGRILPDIDKAPHQREQLQSVPAECAHVQRRRRRRWFSPCLAARASYGRLA